MISNVELIVNGQLLEGCNDIGIQLEYSVKQIQEPSECTGVFSLDFTIPATKANNILFDFIFEINSQTDFNPNGTNTCELRVDDISIFQGRLQLNYVDKFTNTDEHTVNHYNVTLYGYTKSLFIDIKNKYLYELDLSKYDHLPIESNVVNSWTGDFTTGYYYPFIDYNIGFEFNSAANIFPELDVSNMYPATYAKVILDAIFEENGYRYKSNFLNSDAFNKLIIPYSVERKYTTANLAKTTTYNSYYLSTNLSQLKMDSILWDYYGNIYNGYVYWFSSGIQTLTTFQPVISGTYTFKFHINAIDNTSPDLKLQVLRSSIYYTTPNMPMFILGGYDYLYNDYLPGVPTTGISVDVQFTSDVNAGDNIAFVIGDYSANGQILSGSTIDIFYGSDTGFTQYVELERCLPEIVLQSEFLIGLNKMFNLYWEQDYLDPTLFYIEPYEQYYSSTASTFWDWNYKLDLSRNYDIYFTSDLMKQQLDFKYDSADDYWNSWYLDNCNKGLEYGEKLVSYEDMQYFESDKEEISCIPFKPSYVGVIQSWCPEFYFPKYQTDLTYGDYDNRSMNVGLRILYNGGMRHCSDAGNVFWSFEGTGYYSYPYAGHEIYPGNSGSTNLDLNYESVNLGYENQVTNNNLFELYWKNYYNTINDKYNRILKGYFYLTEEDIYKIRFNDVIVLKEAYWKLNVIKYNVGSKIHYVELVKILDNLDFATGSKEWIWPHISGLTASQSPPKSKHNQIISLGIDNLVVNAANCVTVGKGHHVAGSVSGITNNFTIGNNNYLNDVSNSFIKGFNNDINSDGSTIFGNFNYVTTGLSNVFAIGNNITASTSDTTYFSGNININGYNLTALTSNVWEQGSTPYSVQTVGTQCYATNSGATAFGGYTLASGPASTAEGLSNQATGTAAHAEGYFTSAMTSYTHTEGFKTVASNTGAHAEGGKSILLSYGSTASGVYSHAEGVSTLASGVVTHTEGGLTIANGDYSHAQGYQSKTYGDYSHAESYNNTTIAQYSHIGGVNNYLTVAAEGSTITAKHDFTGSTPYTLFAQNVNFSGNQIVGTRLVTTGYTLGLDDYILIVSATTSQDIILPSTAFCEGRIYYIKSVKGNHTLLPNGGDLIDGQVSTPIPELLSSIHCVATNGNWWLL